MHKLLFRIVSAFRNKSLFLLFRQLKELEQAPIEELEQRQREKLVEFITFIHSTNPYYREKLAEVGINPENITAIDLQKLPVVTKSELIAFPERYDNSIHFDKVFNCETSGTSGQVLNFNRNEEWDSFNRASMMRGYSWHGVNYWDYNIYFWGYNFSPLKRIKARMQDFLMNRYRIFTFNENDVNALLRRIYRVNYISGYSSMIYELAKILECRVDKSKLKLKMIKGTSEKIFPHYTDAALKTFGLPIVSEYGAAESGIIAFSCKEGNMHINMEGVVVEVNRDNEILVTNLYSKSFPIIRYKLGDAVKLGPSSFACPCGLAHPTIEDVTGRIGKIIYGNLETYPSLVLYYIFKNLYFDHGMKLSYQGHQTIRGELSIWLTDYLDRRQMDLLKLECEKYFRDDLAVSFEFVKELYQDKGKLRDFISTIS